MVSAAKLRPGDVVPDLGKLSKVIETYDESGSRIVVVTAGVDDVQKVFKPSDSVYAFVVS